MPCSLTHLPSQRPFNLRGEDRNSIGLSDLKYGLEMLTDFLEIAGGLCRIMLIAVNHSVLITVRILFGACDGQNIILNVLERPGVLLVSDYA